MQIVTHESIFDFLLILTHRFEKVINDNSINTYMVLDDS